MTTKKTVQAIHLKTIWIYKRRHPMTRLTDDEARQTIKESNTQDEFPWTIWLWLACAAACWWGIVRLWPW